ncbi:MAG: ATP-binding protein [Spirochaetes bacterium]|nr:MAG: ATP-binding protein [Spirochaetota bacterium]
MPRTNVAPFNKYIHTDAALIAPVVREAIEYLRSLKEQGAALRVDEYYYALSLDEALTNAVQHGNMNDAGKKVHLTIVLRRSSLDIVVTDEGDGYDPEAVPDPRRPECFFKRNGRGIHILKNVACVEWNRKGNAVTIRF